MYKPAKKIYIYSVTMYTRCNKNWWHIVIIRPLKTHIGRSFFFRGVKMKKKLTKVNTKEMQLFSFSILFGSNLHNNNFFFTLNLLFPHLFAANTYIILLYAFEHSPIDLIQNRYLYIYLWGLNVRIYGLSLNAF